MKGCLPLGSVGRSCEAFNPRALVRLSKSVKAEGKLPKMSRLKANEKGFAVVVNVYRPRRVWIPYGAVNKVYLETPMFPNVLVAPLITSQTLFSGSRSSRLWST